MGGRYPTIDELNSGNGRQRYRDRVSQECGAFGLASKGNSVSDTDGKGKADPQSIARATKNVGLRKRDETFYWQVADMYAKGFSARQIALQLARPLEDIEEVISAACEQWGQEYESNLPVIRGILARKLEGYEAAMATRMGELLHNHRLAQESIRATVRDPVEQAKRLQELRFPHRDYRQYQKLLLDIMEKAIALYNIRGELPGDGGVHLHYTVYNQERMVTEDGTAPPIDVESLPVTGQGIVDLGPAPPTPGYEALDSDNPQTETRDDGKEAEFPKDPAEGISAPEGSP